jgi:outer membrane biosynthesis protein TonB
MGSFEPGFVLELGMAIVLGAPLGIVQAPDQRAEPLGAQQLRLADLKVVPETPPPPEETKPPPEETKPPAEDKADAPPHPVGQNQKPIERQRREVSVRPAPKPAPDPVEAKCYDDLLDFSLGNSDDGTNERIKNQDCK